MSDTQTTQAETTSTRTFHRSDYRNAARLVQSMRHVKGDRYTLKPAQQNFTVDDLAAKIAAVFLADAPQAFDAAKFLAGTQLPQDPGSTLPDSPPDDPDE
jgi:hypothetical protein